MNKRLDELLSQEVPVEVKKEKNPFSRIYITKDAYVKASLYAQLARERNGSHIECYGYLIGTMDRKNRIAYDVYFAPGQEPNAAHVYIPSEKVIEAGRDIRENLGMRVLGWWHSHATMPTFHSGTDDANHRTIVNQIAASNYINQYTEKEILSGDLKKTMFGDSKLMICDRNNNSKRLEILFSKLDENPLAYLPIEKLVLRTPKKISYAYSMVVNAIGSKPYGEIATVNFCTGCHKNEYQHEKVPVKVLDYKTGLSLNVKELKKEVKSKIVYPPPRVYIPVTAGLNRIFCGGKGKRGKKGKKGKNRQKQVQTGQVQTGPEQVGQEQIGQEQIYTPPEQYKRVKIVDRRRIKPDDVTRPRKLKQLSGDEYDEFFSGKDWFEAHLFDIGDDEEDDGTNTGGVNNE
ncbi:hypothetical protein GOV14_02425 [Candidatus Pacearchaeota archaeon]|nr:hypothetical protein [Candidatus Pacearchaeota archaeon]